MRSTAVMLWVEPRVPRTGSNSQQPMPTDERGLVRKGQARGRASSSATRHLLRLRLRKAVDTSIDAFDGIDEETAIVFDVALPGAGMSDGRDESGHDGSSRTGGGIAKVRTGPEVGGVRITRSDRGLP